jgi:outer membrane phospholipase A
MLKWAVLLSSYLFSVVLSCQQVNGTEEMPLASPVIIKTNAKNNLMLEYRPKYIIYRKPDSKVQFSFKIKLFESSELFLAYTQTSF